LKDHRGAPGFGYLPQDVESLFLKSTVRDELGGAVPLFLRYLPDGETLLERHPYDLSGGEKQLLALAKLSARKPRLLLLDEPTKGLDAYAKQQTAIALGDLRAAGVTVVAVSHDVEFAALCADRCALFSRGAVTAVAPTRRFFSENAFYTTAVSRMTRGICDNAVTLADAVACRREGAK
ncbi:MAG: ATP-binding cassette domain-containing protein, partial [Clostridia bacterium]|nr:ATP-binding cassette domain-containing protein [Clostridia bacterium]